MLRNIWSWLRSLLVTRFDPLIGLTFSNAARSWRSCPSRHARRLLVLPCQTTLGTATPSNLPDRHYLCRSGVMDTGTHFDRCHLRERGRLFSLCLTHLRILGIVSVSSVLLNRPRLPVRHLVARLFLADLSSVSPLTDQPLWLG